MVVEETEMKKIQLTKSLDFGALKGVQARA